MTDILSTMLMVGGRWGLRRTLRSNRLVEQRDFVGGFREATDESWVQAVEGRDRSREQAEVLGRDVTPSQAPFCRKRIAMRISRV